MSGIEAPKEAPKDAKDVLAKMMPKADELKKGMESNYEAKPPTKEELDEKVGKNRKELSTAEKEDFAEIIEQAKDAIKEAARDGKVSHMDTQKFSIDGVEYTYLRDNSKKGSARDRLFKKA